MVICGLALSVNLRIDEGVWLNFHGGRAGVGGWHGIGTHNLIL